MATVSAILLAAGESTRMGRQKALLPWHGPTLLEYQLRQLASVDAIEEIIVVTGHEPDRITAIAGAAPRASVVHNAEYRTGKVSSIIAGLRALSPDASAVLLLGVDQPRAAAIVARVVDDHRRTGAAISAPAHDGRRGHPVIFARRLLPELLAIREDTQGIRDVMRRHEREIHDVEIDDAAIHLDLNAPGDLAEAE